MAPYWGGGRNHLFRLQTSQRKGVCWRERELHKLSSDSLTLCISLLSFPLLFPTPSTPLRHPLGFTQVFDSKSG